MRSLSAAQKRTLDDLQERYREARTKVATVVDEMITDANAKIAAAIDELNAVRQEADAFRDAVQSDIDSYVGERSEKWLEGDTGSAYQEWLSQWQNDVEDVQFDEITVDVDDLVEEELLSEEDYAREPTT